MTEQAAKRISVEEKFKTAREKSLKKDKENKRRFKRLAKKVADMCSEKMVKTPSEAKIFSASPTCQKQFREQCHTTLSFLGLYIYKILCHQGRGLQ